jgi:entry exclusion lipoprotein TrbK
MMKNKKCIAIAVVLVAAVLVAACKDKPAVASPACADIAGISDPAQKAELIKRCPRNGPDFKPSPVKNW